MPLRSASRQLLGDALRAYGALPAFVFQRPPPLSACHCAPLDPWQTFKAHYAYKPVSFTTHLHMLLFYSKLENQDNIVNAMTAYFVYQCFRCLRGAL